MKRAKSDISTQNKKLKSDLSENSENSENVSSVSESDKEKNESVVASTKSVKKDKPCYEKYFRYEIKDNEKVGICILCENKSISKIIKRKNANTTGLKNHLRISHEEEFRKHFLDEKDVALDQQKTLHHFLTVISFYLNILSKTVNFAAADLSAFRVIIYYILYFIRKRTYVTALHVYTHLIQTVSGFPRNPY